MRIRPARPADAAPIAAILVDLGWFPGLPDDPVAAARHVEARVPDPEDLTRTMVVATDDLDGVAGYAHWTVTHPVFLAGPSLYLTELFIRSDLRGHGVGRALLDHLHEQAAALDAARVELLQHRDRDAYARGFYPRHGYAEADDLTVFRRTSSRQE